MVADTDGARRWGSWTAYRRQPGWVGVLFNALLILCTGALGAAFLFFTNVISGTDAAAAAIAVTTIAAVFGIAAAAARWTHGALVGRVDILTQAFDASPEAE